MSKPFSASGVDGLDEVLGGGYPRGQISLIRGASGAGKTTLSLQFLMAGARQGERTLYLGTSETEDEIRKIAESHGWSLDGVAVHHHTGQELGLQQTMIHPAEIELPQAMESMLSIVRQATPDRVVIDSLAEIRVLTQDEFWYRRQLATLKRHFADNRCTVLVVELPSKDQPTLDSILTSIVELTQTTPAYGPDRRRLRIAKVRGQDFAAGYHDYRIRRGGIDVFPRLTAAEHRQALSSEQVSTGLPQLDAMLKGGLSRGTSILLLGPSGTGKSIIATQLAIAAAQRGERSAFYVFDERVHTLYQRAASIGLDLPAHVESGMILVQQIDPAELTSGQFSHAIRELVEKKGMRLLVLDSLNGYAYAMPEERLLSVHLHELSSYLNQRAVTSIFSMTQHGLISENIEQPFDISYVADTVLLFRHFEFAGQIHKAISVYKCRSGPHESTIRELQITANGVQVGKPLTQFQGILTGSPRFTGDRLDVHDRDDRSAIR